jgi:xanthine dehydrogenase YagR molybdenum-binding subunit
LTKTTRTSTPWGKWIGEVAIVGTAAAIVNAVYDVAGLRIRELPIGLDKVLA